MKKLLAQNIQILQKVSVNGNVHCIGVVEFYSCLTKVYLTKKSAGLTLEMQRPI